MYHAVLYTISIIFLSEYVNKNLNMLYIKLFGQCVIFQQLLLICFIQTEWWCIDHSHLVSSVEWQMNLKY